MSPAPRAEGSGAVPENLPPRMDAHVHLSSWWPDVRRTGYRADLDFSVKGLLSEMDENRIERSLVLELPFAPTESEASAEGQSHYARSRGRLLPVATIDPTRGAASVQASVERLAREISLAGLKLYPGYRLFYPHDARLDPVYEFASRRHLPVLLHQGDTLDGLGLLKFARPLEVDEVAGRFREVRFVLCHLGNPWIDEATELVYKNENVYADTSGLLPHPSARYFPRAVEYAAQRIEAAVVQSGRPDRFLYGSDWPMASLGASVGLVERLGIEEADRLDILGANLARLLPPIALSTGGFSV